MPVVISRPPEDDDAKSVEQRYEEEFLATARDRFRRVVEAETEYRALALEDMEFYDGDQWDEAIAKRRKDDCRPCLTVNRLPQFVHAVSNEIRQNKPAPKISPVDDRGDTETAEVFQGIIRLIERQSNAQAVRSHASFYSIITGRSYYRIMTEYADPASFDQDIFIRRIRNQFSVYMDPDCREADCCDAKYCFLLEDLTEDEFKSKYPDAEVSSLEEFRSIGDGSPIWGNGELIRVCEYFTVDEIDEPMVMLADEARTVVPLSEAPEGFPVADQRTAKRKVVTWAKISGAEILEEQKWAGYYIPVVRMVGEEYQIDGKQHYVGMVRNAKDPQRMLNYWESSKTETIALAPRVPWIVAEGQIENHEQEWRQANTKNLAVLQYKPREVGGAPVPPPQRQVYEPPIQAITIAEGGAVDNLKATTGIYDPSLGNRSNETSGIAIRQRLAQGSTSNYHFIDQVAISIHHEAKVLLDLIPKIYDRPGRVLRILGEDDSERQVMLNQPYNDKGIQRMYDLNAGRYDVAIDVGPTYATRRQESVDSMTAFAQAAPQLVPMYADLYVKAMDWPGAREIAERVRPPGLPPEDGPQIPPQAAAQMQQMQQALQEAQAQNQQLVQMLQAKQVEAESRERIAAADNATRERIAQLQAEIDVISKRADLAGKMQMQDADLAVKRGMQGSDIANQQALQGSAIESTEQMKAADLQSRESIALLNAEIKAATERLKAQTALDKPAQPDRHG